MRFSPRRRKQYTNDHGFTLVEVLVALAIAAVAMVALFRAAAQSTSATVSVENHMAATSLARSLLLDAAQKPIAEPFTRKGDAEGYGYAISASALTGAAGRLAPRGMTLYDVKVTVTWVPRGHYELATVVLGK